MRFPAYDKAIQCTGGPTDGARALMAGCLEAYGTRGATNLGIYNCRKVRGSTSTTSCHGEGRACDVGFPMQGGRANDAGRDLAAKLCRAAGGLGIQTVIYDRTIWSSRSPSGREYTGVSPHYDHVHVELTRAAARQLTLATVRKALGSPAAGRSDVPPFPLPRGHVFGAARGRPKVHSGHDAPADRPGITTLQGRLAKAMSAPVVTDGFFGQKTEAVVTAFQKRRSLEVDGQVGPLTWRALW